MNKLKAHFIGIGGVSQSKLALMLKSFGYEVSGSDREESTQTRLLRENGIKVFVPHSEANIKTQSFVVFNGAISEDNEELKKARALNIPVVKRSVMLAKIAAMHKQCVAVCGSHGKTTTTALLAYALQELVPQIHAGGNLVGTAFKVEENKNLFVTEACEFQKSLLEIIPSHTIMLNIDADHLDCYKNIGEIEKTFLQFANQTKNILIYNNEDFRVKRVAQNAGCKTISFGKGGDVEAQQVKLSKNGIAFKLFFGKKFICTINAHIFGRHNVLNLLAACAAAITLGAKNFAQNLKNFKGVERRMQFLGKVGNNVVIHDYAHHPNEIKATIKACKQHFKKPIIAVFEPHTYSRTKSLWADFTTCFKGAECTYMLPIYSAREKGIAGITSSALAAATENCTFVRGRAELLMCLKKHQNYIVLIMGAGSIEKLAHHVAQCGV